MSQLTPAHARTLESLLKERLRSPKECKPMHRRYRMQDPEHPGWILAGCDDCGIHITVTEEQAAAWESIL